ncbi:MAG: hypothetical protein BWZ10_00569 [candidate division BRC1 bacterium ADurb.BinA364]|nr:MAG: hypothetical protein BWZ10_00569 [candidate division BRC1 bacterium ADurb.BinA364]
MLHAFGGPNRRGVPAVPCLALAFANRRAAGQHRRARRRRRPVLGASWQRRGNDHGLLHFHRQPVAQKGVFDHLPLAARADEHPAAAFEVDAQGLDLALLNAVERHAVDDNGVDRIVAAPVAGQLGRRAVDHAAAAVGQALRRRQARQRAFLAGQDKNCFAGFGNQPDRQMGLGQNPTAGAQLGHQAFLAGADEENAGIAFDASHARFAVKHQARFEGLVAVQQRFDGDLAREGLAAVVQRDGHRAKAIRPRMAGCLGKAHGAGQRKAGRRGWLLLRAPSQYRERSPEKRRHATPQIHRCFRLKRSRSVKTEPARAWNARRFGGANGAGAQSKKRLPRRFALF